MSARISVVGRGAVAERLDGLALDGLTGARERTRVALLWAGTGVRAEREAVHVGGARHAWRGVHDAGPSSLGEGEIPVLAFREVGAPGGGGLVGGLEWAPWDGRVIVTDRLDTRPDRLLPGAGLSPVRKPGTGAGIPL
ncbi:hypothetical protein QUV83_04485 [Cellulomonas cellasea]|uniref:hypothetical protein n=1 Tax=Cellulomonas cellasea TaxID=43670 RepID=UPI0025A35623|nr:hypothetical protein [Cellulomonas cellasea]MDM8084019.1 hypothetical protein [Cellulomonas cellasea]